MVIDVVQWFGVQVPLLPLGLGLGSRLASPHPSSKPHPSRGPTACAGGLPDRLHLGDLRARRRPDLGDQVRRRVRVRVRVRARVRVRVRFRVRVGVGVGVRLRLRVRVRVRHTVIK